MKSFLNPLIFVAEILKIILRKNYYLMIQNLLKTNLRERIIIMIVMIITIVIIILVIIILTMMMSTIWRCLV